MATWQELHGSMAERWRPEDVAAVARELVPHLATVLRVRGAYYGSPAWDRFGRPGFRGHAVDTSITRRFPGLPHDALAAVTFLTAETGLESNDLRDRLPAPLRRAAGITISRRQYMKQCRILLALRRKMARVVERGAFVRWTRIAQSGWAVDITLDDFLKLTPETRVFVAYYVARRQRQSVFSGTGQEKPWDRLAAALFEYVIPAPAVASVFADQRVLGALSNTERTWLLVRAYRELLHMARTLREMWDVLGADRATMVVRRGMNSSDWNALAGAWNSVRGLWVALLYACGRERDLETFCPGKVMRLMAADVAAWHRMIGDDEGPDVKLFKQLPLPWDVVLGLASCTREDVTQARAAAGVRNDTWTTAPSQGEAIATKPTRALVHGVAVDDPALADVLRRAGWFSAKNAKPVPLDVMVARDEHGFALEATEGRSSAIEQSAL